MPSNVVKTPEDEKKWDKAKDIAAEAGKAENYAYIMGVYKKMKPDHFKGKTSSVSRHAEIWKASNGKWYLDLAPYEYGEWEDSITYGPFPSERAADKYLAQSFSNPGSLEIDDGGDRSPPTRSPNGDPVQKPRSGRGYGSRWAAEASRRVAARFMERQGGFGAPREVGSAKLLKRQGFTPVEVFFGEVRPRPSRAIVMQGESVQDRRGNVFFFVGVGERGEAILGKTEGEYDRLKRQLKKDRGHHETPEKRSAAWVPGEVRDENGWEYGRRSEEPDELEDDDRSMLPEPRDE